MLALYSSIGITSPMIPFSGNCTISNTKESESISITWNGMYIEESSGVSIYSETAIGESLTGLTINVID